MADAEGIPGTYKAWLSDETGSPSTRFTRSDRPYVMVNGTIVATNWTDLTDGSIINPIRITEKGGRMPNTPIKVWTGTGENGTKSLLGSHCSNWDYRTSVVWSEEFGVIGDYYLKTNKEWTEFDIQSCFDGLQSHIYCFEQ